MNWQRKQVIVSWKNIPSINLEKKKQETRLFQRANTFQKVFTCFILKC